MSTDPLERLAWDSAHFGFPVARVAAPRIDAAMLDAAIDACERERIRCAYLLVDAEDAHGSQLAQKRGFVLRDVRVELSRPLDAAGVPDFGNSLELHDAHPDQVGALEMLVRERFTDSRFFADPAFPRERCRELYVAFLRRGLETTERRTLTTPGADGFVVCHFDEAASTGTIDLIAVSARSAGKGVGGALVAAATREFTRAGLERTEVVTQAANVAAQRVYQRAGFRTHRVGLWFHRWLS